MEYYREHKKGLIGTIIFHILVLILLIFLGFFTPLPLPGEEGILVNFGTSENGLGDREPSPARRNPEPVQTVQQEEESAPPPASTPPPPPASQPETQSAEEVTMTQDYEQTAAIDAAEKKKREQEEARKKELEEIRKKQEEEEAEPPRDPRDLKVVSLAF
ncbi:MAG: hypothetical protein R3182_11010, partial [Draconibacterium sp.]|nr:hypothetical protein [Draconibacterium sp.]